MTLEELNFARSHLQNADLLTWSHVLGNAKSMWLAYARIKEMLEGVEKNAQYKVAAGHAMIFLQTLWVIPKEWEKIRILSPVRSLPEFSPTYAQTEMRAYEAIAKLYELKGEKWNDPLQRHFETNRIVRQNNQPKVEAFNPHLLNKANSNEVDL